MIITESGWNHLQTRFAEWQNGLIMLGWGGFVLLHPGLFADPRTSIYWQGMLQMASQPSWGILAFSTGFVRLAALYINGRHHRTPTVRLIASFFSAFVLCQMCLGLAKSGLPAVNLVLYPILLLADLYSAYRASADMTFVSRKAELSRGGSA